MHTSPLPRTQSITLVIMSLNFHEHSKPAAPCAMAPFDFLEEKMKNEKQ